MLQITQLDLQRSGKPLFEQASLTLHSGQRFALVGNNGTGKSSLFQAILGDLEPDSGDINLPKDWRIAHMAQELESLDRQAVDYVIDGFTQLRQLQAAQLDAESAKDDTKLVTTLAELDAIDAYSVPHRCEQILQGLGFSQADFQKPVKSFSGGWRIRLNLARALLQPSELLLLDEPTNHLDIEAIYWLEDFLTQYAGAILLISHDRDFIDHTVNHIAHLADRKLTLYSGTYSGFERQRAEKLSQQQALFDKQQAEIKHMESFVERFRAKASKAKQAQSRLKALSRLPLIAAVRAESAYHFDIPYAEKTSSPLLNSFKLALGYKDKPILEGCTFSILPGMRIGLLGENGAGKSTLLKTLVGDLPILSGELVRGEHLAIGYFAQHQIEALDMQASPALHLQRLSPKASDQAVRNFLGKFMIKGDMAVEPITHFSGGEKARLALAVLAWQKPNLLILDEPTNHLDISMREALSDAIQQFEGAVLLVSHDRYLLRHCVDEFWLAEQGKLTAFEGDLDDYHNRATVSVNEASSTQTPESNQDKKQKRQAAAEQRAKIAPITKVIKKIEKQMDALQKKLDQVREHLADASIYEEANKTKLQQALDDEKQFSNELESLEAQWLEQEEALQAFQDSGDH